MPTDFRPFGRCRSRRSSAPCSRATRRALRVQLSGHGRRRAGCVPGLGQRLAGAQQGLGGHAGPEVALPAQQLALDEGDLLAGLAETVRAVLAARAAADDDDVEVAHGWATYLA